MGILVEPPFHQDLSGFYLEPRSGPLAVSSLISSQKAASGPLPVSHLISPQESASNPLLNITRGKTSD